MKKILILILTCTSLFYSCSKQSSEAKKADTKKPTVDGVMLYEESHYWKETAEEKMRWVDYISKGDTVKIYTNADGTPESKKSVREGKTEEETFYHINIEERGDFWTIDWYLAVNAQPGAILEDCFVYSEPKSAAVTSTKLKKFEIVGILEEKDNFYKVNVRDDKQLRQNIYIEKKVVCNHENDVEAIKTYRRITGNTNAAVQYEVIDKLINDWALGANNPRLCRAAYISLVSQLLSDADNYVINYNMDNLYKVYSVYNDLYSDTPSDADYDIDYPDSDYEDYDEDEEENDDYYEDDESDEEYDGYDVDFDFDDSDDYEWE